MQFVLSAFGTIGVGWAVGAGFAYMQIHNSIPPLRVMAPYIVLLQQGQAKLTATVAKMAETLAILLEQSSSSWPRWAWPGK